jgi:hypothetical protein
MPRKPGKANAEKWKARLGVPAFTARPIALAGASQPIVRVRELHTLFELSGLVGNLMRRRSRRCRVSRASPRPFALREALKRSFSVANVDFAFSTGTRVRATEIRGDGTLFGGARS